MKTLTITIMVHKHKPVATCRAEAGRTSSNLDHVMVNDRSNLDRRNAHRAENATHILAMLELVDRNEMPIAIL